MWLYFHEFSGDYAFMGSLIIKEVVNELLTKGLDKAKVLLLAGSRSVTVLQLPCNHVFGAKSEMNLNYFQIFDRCCDNIAIITSHNLWTRPSCHQRGRRGCPDERGPCRRPAGVTGSPEGAGQRSG